MKICTVIFIAIVSVLWIVPVRGDVTDSLVAHWTFDETQGSTVYDSSGTNHGTIYGNPTRTAGKVDGALYFDGIDDYIDIPDDVSLRPQYITMSAWIKTAIKKDNEILLKSRNSDAYYEQYALYVSSNGIASGSIKRNSEGRPGIGWHICSGHTILNSTDWYLVTSTWDGSIMKTYINGQLDGINDSVPSGSIDNYAGGTLRIGMSWSHVPVRFQGIIDDVRIYNRALSSDEIQQLYAMYVYVDANGGDNAFATIQQGIDAAGDGSTVFVHPGVYNGTIDFKGKAITLQGVASDDGVPVLENADGIAVGFLGDEGPDSVLKNFIIKNSIIGILVENSSPTISNVTLVDNFCGIIAQDAQPDISNCIFWNNYNGDMIGCQARFSCTIEEGSGQNNINADPLFVDPNNGDYHLLSQRGRYWPEHNVWVLDKVTSPAIDAGDPNADFSDEPVPNGGRINMGAYGGTAYASMKEKANPYPDINEDRIIDIMDLSQLIDQWLEAAGWR
jgi:hypothetical protein